MENEEERRYALLQLKAMLRRATTKEAFERLERVKYANPELYSKAVQAVLYAYQTGNRVVDENMLIKILDNLRGKKKETRIKILRK